MSNKSKLQFGQKFNNMDRNNCDEKAEINWSNYGFSRDLSRIVFSNSYRRMAGKTQIFPPYSNEHLMSRLTHTIIVNNIAVDIAQRINRKYDNNVNIDLIQAIANGHDIGHTPFGHAGERKLKEILENKEYFSDKYYFKRNIFSVNILQNLDRVKNYDYGYDLAWQVIDGILKHTEVPYDDKYISSLKYIINNKFINSKNLLKSIKQIDSSIDSYYQYKYPLTIEGQIVKISDEIAQYYHDVLDLSRFFDDKKTVGDFIEKIFLIPNNEKSEYVNKFINTFTIYKNDKKTINKKIEEFDNREFFCNELKELFINDVVEKIGKCTESDIIVNISDNSSRFIVKNVLFILDSNNKVIPAFCSDYVKSLAKTFVEYRNNKLNERDIMDFDKKGKLIIDETLNSFLADYNIFYKFCVNDVIEGLKKYFKLNKTNIKIDMITIDDKNIDNNKEKIVKSLFDLYIDKKTVDNIEINNEDKIKNIVYSCILMSIARMTDQYLVNRKYI